MTTSSKRLGARIAVVAMFLLFFLPVLVAWVLNIYWRDSPLVGTTNYGNLITPARQLDAGGLLDLSGDRLMDSGLTGQWRLVLWLPEQCQDVCHLALANLHRARLALGKDMDRVQRHLLVPKSYAGESAVQRLLRDDNGLVPLVASEHWLKTIKDLASTPILIIDPQGYLIMTYAIAADPSGVLKDLQRLLKISKVG